MARAFVMVAGGPPDKRRVGASLSTHADASVRASAGLPLRRRDLAGRRDVVRAHSLERVLGAVLLLAVFGVDGDQDVAVAKAPLVDLRLILGDAEADERP